MIELPDSTRAWVQAALGKPANWRRLAGGVNNIVYRCDADGRPVIVKCFPQAGPAGDDRFIAEREFLDYAGRVAPGFTPSLVAADARSRTIVMSAIDGTLCVSSMVVSSADVERASAFLVRLNADRTAARAAISRDAADGHLSISAHIADVDRRLGEMQTDHLPARFQADGQAALADLQARWQAARQAALDQGAAIDRVDASMTCVSPSDFGFHNAIRTPSGLVFFDFEFAGWDDPAKTLVDFSLQLRIPVPPSMAASMERALAEITPLDMLRRRAGVLRPVLRIKWLSIVLAVLRPRRFEAMVAIDRGAGAETLVAERLAAAHRYAAGP